ncbi:MAG: hypothetical protein CBC38_05300 [Gammaproteobacteria bacterium TMED78]|nr:MAG: hypothetical protein CBC38_05300 [Gammaproteobacteria bacterium TMED78]|tara:strand:- start:37837 stop:38226 length:390 start_codon:yes stop_codon:yes gene_type:complete
MFGWIRYIFLFFLACPFLALSHHSVALNFTQEIVTVEGRIKDIKWINPHASFVLEVTNEAGEKEDWLVELLAVIALRRSNFNFDALTNGASIKLSGRNGIKKNTMRFGEAILSDGTSITENAFFYRRDL